MESRSRLFDFDIRYKTREATRHCQKAERAQWNRGADYLISSSATRQGEVTRRCRQQERVQVQDKEQLREKADRAHWSRGADYLILISATGGASSMESRSRPFDFDIRYKTGGVTRHRQQQDKEQLREKAERAQWNRGADYLILISATRQGKLREIFSNKARNSYKRRRSELNGIEAQTI